MDDHWNDRWNEPSDESGNEHRNERWNGSRPPLPRRTGGWVPIGNYRELCEPPDPAPTTPGATPGATPDRTPDRTPGSTPDAAPAEPGTPAEAAWAARQVIGLPVHRLRAFTLEMLRLHRLVPATPAFIPMCSCQLPARHCAVIRAEHELLGVAVPFRFGPPSYRDWP